MENSEFSEFCDEDVFSVVDITKIDSFLPFDDGLEDEIDVFNMASLGNFILLEHTLNRNEALENREDEKLHRLSLAYEKLHTMPKILQQELAPIVRILDLSHNEFDNLDFLSEFKVLTTLICDHNNISSNANIPYMPKLELLWLNHCKVSSLYPWAKKLQSSCPNLKYLSLMGNSGAPSYLNGGNFYEYLQYRLDYLVGTTVNILLRSPHSWHNIGRAYFIKLQSFIDINFSEMPKIIQCLEQQNVETKTCYKKFESLVEHLSNLDAPICKKLKEKWPAPGIKTPPLFIISLFPKLIHLDDRPVTSDQRTEAERLYRKPFVERLVMKTQTSFPEYLRQISDVVSDILTPAPSFVAPEKNVIV